MKAFHQRRLQELRQSLIYYVEVGDLGPVDRSPDRHPQGQIKCSRESQAALTTCLAKMQEFSLPQVGVHMAANSPPSGEGLNV